MNILSAQISHGDYNATLTIPIANPNSHLDIANALDYLTAVNSYITSSTHSIYSTKLINNLAQTGKGEMGWVRYSIK